MLLRVGGERGYRRRLLELGFIPGTPLRMVRRVDVGDILEVELRHSRVSLRLSEARGIEVDLSAPVVAPAGAPASACGPAECGPECGPSGSQTSPFAASPGAPKMSPFAGGKPVP